MQISQLFDPIEPYRTHQLAVSDVHTLYIEECGNPNGEPILFLHGGPGGSISPLARRFFDPAYYRIILFDQRGTGKSTPFLELKDNSLPFLISDIEVIRKYFQISSWHIFGGSFGSTIALTYAIQHPKNVRSLILRGIFLGRQEDVDWLYQDGASHFYPEKFEIFKNHIAPEKQHDLVKAYYELLTSSNLDTIREAARIWSDWESGIVELTSTHQPNQNLDDTDLSLAVLECHFFANKTFANEDNYILNHTDAIKDIPTFIVHGRYDVDCRPSGAFTLAKQLNNCELKIAEAEGHTPYSPGMIAILREFLEKVKQL